MTGPTPVEITKKCIWCGESSVIVFKDEADWNAYWAWKEGALIQRAFGHWTPGKRETLINGTHEKCFDEMFLPDDECSDHMWPEELTFDARCEKCGLKFGEWADD